MSDPAPTMVAPNGDTLTEMPNITRVELIDYSRGGGIYSNWSAREVAISVQDDGRTLKVFVKGVAAADEAAQMLARLPLVERRALAEMFRLGMLNAANSAEHMGAAAVAQTIRDLSHDLSQSEGPSDG